MEMIKQNPPAIKGLRTLFDAGSLGGLTDGQLLSRFVDDREEAVFEAIVERHGPMVWGVCRRVVRDHHDAEDAFQATFLVLARKAATVQPRGKLANWLYGVAYQTAVKTRAMISRRRTREKQVLEMTELEAARDAPWDDRLGLLDEELDRMPEKYRIPIVLCDLEGMTHRQAAEQLGWPVGTVSGRLSRARTMLAERLRRRGVAVATGSLGMLMAGESAAGVPSRLVLETTTAAVTFAAGRAAAGGASPMAVAVAETVLRGMLMSKLGIATTVLMVAVLGATVARSSSPGGNALATSPARGFETSGRGDTGDLSSSRAVGRNSRSADEELKNLAGTWAITDLAFLGERSTKEQKEEGLGRAVIKGDKLTVYTSGEERGQSFSIDVDPNRTPKALSLIWLDEKLEDHPSSPILLGIYELKGDTLRICAGADRPEEFEVPAGSKRLLLVLKWARR